jgi:hypothetical protein
VLLAFFPLRFAVLLTPFLHRGQLEAFLCSSGHWATQWIELDALRRSTDLDNTIIWLFDPDQPIWDTQQYGCLDLP